MRGDFLDERRRALEEAFFARHNDELIRRLRAGDPGRTEKERLAEVSGLHDDALLERLVALGIRGATFAALSLVPLVAVAWSDGTLGERQREAILGAARGAGLGPEGEQLLSGWLSRPPPPELLPAWTDYVHALGPEARAVLRRQVMDRATGVAESANGLVGLFNGISPSERAVLDRLNAALSA